MHFMTMRDSNNNNNNNGGGVDNIGNNYTHS